MLKIYTVYLLLLCVSTSLIAQTLERQQSFTWLSADEIHDYPQSPIRFNEISGWDDETQLPYFSLKIPLQQYVNRDAITISCTTQTTLFEQTAAIDFLSALSPRKIRLINKHVVTINKKHYLQIEITPLEYEPASGLCKKVEHIVLNISIPENLQAGALKTSASLPDNSVLSQGKWVKIKVLKSGIHKIPYAALSNWGFSNPSKVNVFGNGGNMLPKANNTPRLNDLTENAVMHFDNAVYFYAQGSTAWSYNKEHGMFEHQLHDYTDEAYYFLSDNSGAGKRVEPSTFTSSAFTRETDLFDSYQFHELENQNILKSGAEWYGLRFESDQEREYPFDFKNLAGTEPVKILTCAAGRSRSVNTFTTRIDDNSQIIGTISIPPADYSSPTTQSFANEGIGQAQFYSNSKSFTVKLRYNTSSPASIGWLNYIILNAKEKLVLVDQLAFRNASVSGNGLSTRFYIQGIGNNSVLWDITNHTSAKRIDIETYGSKHGFTYQTDNLREFVAFNTNADLPQPEFVSTVANQNLHQVSVPDMLIIAHPLFKDQADRLADIHFKHSGLQCLVVEPEQIYNEFSSGSPDVSALRDFARYFYLKSDKFKYLLLFGDGSYDNKTYSDENTNFILTYQSENSINVSKTYTSDDFFACLDDNEGGNILNNKPDIGIGRFPTSSLEHAETVVDKIDNYLNKNETGTWKTNITFVADDNQENENNLHIRDAEKLSKMVYEDHPDFNQNKIYLDSYTKVITSTGARYPDVNKAIKEQLENGTLIFNYTGHGNEKTLAHEQILTIDDIKQLTNKNKLPVFVTATCEFSRYDEYRLITAGEWVLLSPEGGGIGLFTTTRIAWSSYNSEINKNFYQYIFNKKDDGKKIRLGDVIKHTKNSSSNTVNKLNFTLLGDPALELQFPGNTVQTTHINGEEDPALRTSLKAGTIAAIRGEIVSDNSSADFKTLNIKVFDKPVKVKTRGNGGFTPFEYELYKNRIFEGSIDVNKNHFLSTFIVPKDIALNTDKGRISYYSYDNDGNEAFGADNSVLIGGISDDPLSNDLLGPEIKIWLNDSLFQDGDKTGTQAVLYAQIEDESGINMSGAGIGHDISLVIDNKRTSPVNLNSYYRPVSNSFTKGSLQYQLPPLEIGEHTLQLKVWDNLNNSSVAALTFQVHLNGTLDISHVAIYPNPVKPNQTVKIYFEHDAPNQLLYITGKVYSMDGRLIQRFEKEQPAIGTAITPIEWTPGALQKGMYILYYEIRSSENQIGKLSEKILLIK